MIAIINDDGWTLATSSWSLGAPPDNPNQTFLSYFWGQKGTPQAWSITLYRPIDEVLGFIADKAAEGICDLRPMQIQP